MALTVSNSQTLEDLRVSHNDLVDDVGGIGSLRTGQKGSLVDAVNSIIDEYFYFDEYEFSASGGTNESFTGADIAGNTLKYSVNRLMVFKNGTLLRNGTNYSAANGSSITIVGSTTSGDIISVKSFTGSYEGTAAAQASQTVQWTKTGTGSLYNINSGGVVINSDADAVVTSPASGYGIQLESTGDDVLIETGASNTTKITGDINVVGDYKKDGSALRITDLGSYAADVRGQISASGDLSYNSSTGVMSFTAGASSVIGLTDTPANYNSAAGKYLKVNSGEDGVEFDALTTDDVTEGTNQFYTADRTMDYLGGATTAGEGIVAGTNVGVTYDDANNTLTISSTGKTQEEIEDIVGAMTSVGEGLDVTYDDENGTLTFAGEDASTSNKGVASFSSDNFSVSSGEVTIKDNGVILGTETTGDFIQNLVAGTGVSVSTTSGEGHQPTVAVAASGVTAGSYGSGSAIPSITVDATGRITAASTSSVDTYSGFDFGTSTSDATVAETENVYIAGGTGIDASFSSDGTTHTVTLTQDLNELTTSTTNAHGDYFVVVDSADPYTTRKLTKANVNISGFNNDSNFITGITSSMVTTALGYTPYNNTNPSGYVTSSGVTSVSGSGGVSSTGTSTPTLSLDTSHNAQFNSLGVNTAGSGTAGEIRATNNITAYYSDEQLKDFEGTIPNALDKVMSINGYYFKENQTAKELGYDNDNRQVGVSAQEIQSILPEVVVPAPIDDKYLTVHYDKLVPLLIEAIKELKSQLDSK